MLPNILELGVVEVDRGDNERESRRTRRGAGAGGGFEVGGLGVDMDNMEAEAAPMFDELPTIDVDVDRDKADLALGLETECMNRRVV